MKENRVRELRMALNLSQEQLGECTNISEASGMMVGT